MNERWEEQELHRLENDPKALQMKAFIQHGRVTTYDHCKAVARMSLRIAHFLPFHFNLRSLTRGAFLHDYYLYDWHTHNDQLHGYHHPAIAVRNAKRDFQIGPEEERIILSHMWPLTLRTFPSSREAVVVSMADKIISMKETILRK